MLYKNPVTKAGFIYDNITSLQIDDANRVGAAVLAHVVSIVDLERGLIVRAGSSLFSYVALCEALYIVSASRCFCLE